MAVRHGRSPPWPGPRRSASCESASVADRSKIGSLNSRTVAARSLARGGQLAGGCLPDPRRHLRLVEQGVSKVGSRHAQRSTAPLADLRLQRDRLQSLGVRRRAAPPVSAPPSDLIAATGRCRVADVGAAIHVAHAHALPGPRRNTERIPTAHSRTKIPLDMRGPFAAAVAVVHVAVVAVVEDAGAPRSRKDRRRTRGKADPRTDSRPPPKQNLSQPSLVDRAVVAGLADRRTRNQPPQTATPATQVALATVTIHEIAVVALLVASPTTPLPQPENHRRCPRGFGRSCPRSRACRPRASSRQPCLICRIQR